MKINRKLSCGGYVIGVVLYTALASGCTQRSTSIYNVAELAVRSKLPESKDVTFGDVYETTPDLHGSSNTPNYKRSFICGHVSYKDETERSIKARFIYLSHSEDPEQAGKQFINVERLDINYGIRDESGGYATPFEFSGWNKICVNGKHPKTYSGVVPQSDE